MKTLYNLEIGDVYYIKIFTLKNVTPHMVVIDDSFGLSKLNMFITNNMAYLTEEECQKSIDYNLAFSKVKKRASELQGDWVPNWEDIRENKYHVTYKNFAKDSYLDFSSETVKNDGSFMYFKDFETVSTIIDELERECRVLLDIDTI